jgi:hypothetical protein
METSLYFPPNLSKELEKLKQSGISKNYFIRQAVAEKFKRDFNIELDATDRRRKGKLYRAK